MIYTTTFLANNPTMFEFLRMDAMMKLFNRFAESMERERDYKISMHITEGKPYCVASMLVSRDLEYTLTLTVVKL